MRLGLLHTAPVFKKNILKKEGKKACFFSSYLVMSFSLFLVDFGR